MRISGKCFTEKIKEKGIGRESISKRISRRKGGEGIPCLKRLATKGLDSIDRGNARCGGQKLKKRNQGQRTKKGDHLKRKEAEGKIKIYSKGKNEALSRERESHRWDLKPADHQKGEIFHLKHPGPKKKETGRKRSGFPGKILGSQVPSKKTSPAEEERKEYRKGGRASPNTVNQKNESQDSTWTEAKAKTEGGTSKIACAQRKASTKS